MVTIIEKEMSNELKLVLKMLFYYRMAGSMIIAILLSNGGQRNYSKKIYESWNDCRFSLCNKPDLHWLIKFYRLRFILVYTLRRALRPSYKPTTATNNERTTKVY